MTTQKIALSGNIVFWIKNVKASREVEKTSTEIHGDVVVLGGRNYIIDNLYFQRYPKYPVYWIDATRGCLTLDDKGRFTWIQFKHCEIVAEERR